MTWIIQANDGRTWKTCVRAEAVFYAWLSIEFCAYNVYEVGGSLTPLLFPYDIN